MLFAEVCPELVTTEPAGVSSVSLWCVTDHLLGRKQILLQPELIASPWLGHAPSAPGAQGLLPDPFLGLKKEKKPKL